MDVSSLGEFVTNVKDAIGRVSADGRFGPRKVFVSAIWNALPRVTRNAYTVAEFKSRLVAAHRAALLSLSRADLVAAMEPTRVEASEIVYECATWHFVNDAYARDPWE
jgi:hypothetical protein